MDLLELFEPDEPGTGRRRDGAQDADEPRRRGVGGFFRRWMASFSEDDDDSRPDGRTRQRRDTDFGWD